MKLTGNERVDYALEVWEAWRKYRGYGPLDWSSAEYDLVRRLMDEGAPLRIVLRGIEDCGKPPSARTSLLYAEPAIREALQHWARSQTA